MRRLRFPATIAATAAVAALTGLSWPAPAAADFLHTVMPGESLTSIAAADGLTVDQLAEANGLSPDAELVVGSTVAIPPQTAADVAGQAPPAAGGLSPAAGETAGDSPGGTYLVQPGDTLTGVAESAGLTVAQLAAANGLSPDAELISGTTLTVPSPSAAAQGGQTSSSAGQPTAGSAGGSYVVQPGDTLTAIAERAGLTVDELAALNGLDPTGLLLSGTVLTLSSQEGPSAPTVAPAVGTTLTGRMTWFGGPHDPSAQGAPASGLGWLSDGMAFYNYGSLGNRWLIHFPWGEALPMTQIDIGPAPWTGNTFDLADSALPSTPYNWQTWPNPTVTGTYLGP